MVLNHIKFVKKMLDKYHNIYSNILSDDCIADIISEVLLEAPDSYFTYEMVQENQEFCAKCGACCQTIDCQYFNGRTCDEYATRFDACMEFPFYEIDYRSGLMLDAGCKFAVRLAEKVLDEKFKKELDFLEVDEK